MRNHQNVGSDRFAEIISVPPLAGGGEVRTQSEVSQSLSVQALNLKVQTGQGEKHLLKDISFEVQAGEFAAIVGEVGSGKSLLLMSIIGETAATFGSLRLGKVELANTDAAARRRYFGFVPQDGFVMSANLRENVIFRYGAGAEFDAGVLRALRAAQFDPHQEGIQDGLSTEFGERGVNLSGGQKQRIGLARAAYFRYPIILLDDALSAVDVETEKQLFSTLLFGEWASTTRLMVTHRLSVLEKVDRVFFMKSGQIRSQGRFLDLVERDPDFRDFIRSLRTPEPVNAEDSSAPKSVLHSSDIVPESPATFVREHLPQSEEEDLP
jgi:ABC-type bacteriocin/lantibiotic exporter with double-glycine peptidase domain